ncbi:MAG: DegV family protein [Desulfotomaculales bacterium]
MFSVRRVAIVTDSTADLSPQLLVTYDITVVPLKVLFGQEVLRDGVDITSEQFYDRLRKGELSGTSQPSPGEFLAAYTRLLACYESVISLHISGSLSGTVQSAQLARSMLAGKDITVIDTRTTSVAQGYLVLRAAQMALEGRLRDEILAVIHALLPQVKAYFVVDSLEYLQRGGRIGRAQGFVGTVLNIKPICTIREGIVYPYEKVRGCEKALQRLVDLLAQAASLQPTGYSLVHGDFPEGVQYLEERASRILGHGPDIVARAGAVIGTHTGPGLAGIIYYPKTKA